MQASLHCRVEFHIEPHLHCWEEGQYQLLLQDVPPVAAPGTYISLTLGLLLRSVFRAPLLHKDISFTHWSHQHQKYLRFLIAAYLIFTIILILLLKFWNQHSYDYFSKFGTSKSSQVFVLIRSNYYYYYYFFAFLCINSYKRWIFQSNPNRLISLAGLASCRGCFSDWSLTVMTNNYVLSNVHCVFEPELAQNLTTSCFCAAVVAPPPSCSGQTASGGRWVRMALPTSLTTPPVCSTESWPSPAGKAALTFPRSLQRAVPSTPPSSRTRISKLNLLPVDSS